ncbi:Pisatin demethylase [Penicillium rolfsii]|nr:Pisatin demethylase [Penicillium rolfsii]
MNTSLLVLVAVFFLALQLLLWVGRALFSPLRDIPGPFWTRFTSLWYFNRVYHGQFEQDNIKLHQKYGPVVRVAPNQYSISDISAIKTVYGAGSQFPKSAWYDGWRHPKLWTLFTDRDIKRHGETRKRFTNLYAMSSLVHYEPFVDYCADIFVNRLNEFADSKATFNLGHWFQCYAFDVIGNITFGERFGFLDRGDDIDGAMDAVHKVMAYSTLVGIFPEWHPRLFGLLSKFKWSGAGGRAYIVKFVQEKIRQHEEKKFDSEAPETIQAQDFVDKLMLAREKNPEKVTDYHLSMMGQSNVAAGSDTTAISLSSIMWHLLQNPETLQKLVAEIDDFTAKGNGKVTFKESQDMPYFQAVIKEALRMHSATGLPMWRVVPAGGAQIGGRVFPERTVVGVNTWVAHYDERVFQNAKAFRPERWLEAENEPEKLKEMNQMYMPFGLGSRTCIGKHISILEMSKLIPRLLREFEFTPLRKNWTTQNFWFVKPTDFEVQVKRRTT